MVSAISRLAILHHVEDNGSVYLNTTHMSHVTPGDRDRDRDRARRVRTRGEQEDRPATVDEKATIKANFMRNKKVFDNYLSEWVVNPNPPDKRDAEAFFQRHADRPESIRTIAEFLEKHTSEFSQVQEGVDDAREKFALLCAEVAYQLCQDEVLYPEEVLECSITPGEEGFKDTMLLITGIAHSFLYRDIDALLDKYPSAPDS